MSGQEKIGTDVTPKVSGEELQFTGIPPFRISEDALLRMDAVSRRIRCVFDTADQYWFD